VYLCDMLELPIKASAVHQEFLNGNFVVKRSVGGFNRISVDQALEHVNKASKDAGGIIGLTKKSTRLDEWYLSCNEIGAITNTFLSSLKLNVYPESQNIEMGKQRLVVDEQTVLILQEQLLKFGVFTQSAEHLISISSKEIFPKELEISRLCVKERGETALGFFIETMDTMDFYKPLKKLNKSTTVKRKPEKSATKSETLLGQQFLQKILAAKEMGRNVDYSQIFQHELTTFPMSLTINGQLNTPSNKSALGNIIESHAQFVNKNLPNVENTKTCHIFDGMSIVQSLGKPKQCRTFGEYSQIFSNIIFKNKHGAQRIDVVLDHYKENSIKNVTRKKRGPQTGILKIIENLDTPLPQQWHLFIHSVQNKKQLTNFLSEQLFQNSLSRNVQFVTAGGFTNVTDFKTNFPIDKHSSDILTANHEEADTRIILHALSAKLSGYSRCIIECSDTDVLILLVHFKKYLTSELWMKVGRADNVRYIPVHEINLSEALSKNLPAFHALTGCDTTSQFGGLGKKSCWKIYLEYHHYLNSVGVDDFSDDIFGNMHDFVLNLYSKNADITSINTLRGLMAASTSFPKLPPTKDALKQHCLRVHYQTKVWLNAMVPCPQLPPIEEFGWYMDEKGEVLPVLTTLPPLPEKLTVLTSCGCKKDCASKVCTCKKSKLGCIGACKCMAQKSCRNALTITAASSLPPVPQNDSESSDDE
jgi:hypothetical protein